MPQYRSRYQTHKGRVQYTQVYAENDAHLEEVLALRGMGETRVDPTSIFEEYDAPQMASELCAAGKLAAANHALVWTGMIAAKAGIADAWAMLNDDGIIHDLAHEMHSKEASPLYTLSALGFNESRHVRLARRIEAFERLVPGVHPCWAGEDTSVVRAPNYRSPFADLYQPKLTDLMERFAMFRKAADSMKLTMDEFAFLRDVPVREPAEPKTPNQRGFEMASVEQGHKARTEGKAKLVEKLKAQAKARKSKVPQAGTMTINGKEYPVSDVKVHFTSKLDEMQAQPRLGRKRKTPVAIFDIETMSAEAIRGFGGKVVGRVHDEIMIAVDPAAPNAERTALVPLS